MSMKLTISKSVLSVMVLQMSLHHSAEATGNNGSFPYWITDDWFSSYTTGDDQCAATFKGQANGLGTANCDQQYPFICKHKYNSNDLKITQRAEKWDMGHQACNDEFGDNYQFAIYADREEFETVIGLQANQWSWVNYFKTADDRRHRNPLDHRGETWTSRPFIYSHWASNEPNRDNGYCVVMGQGNYEGYWYADNCDNQHQVICRSNDRTQWRITKQAVSWMDGDNACKAQFGSDFDFAIPSTNEEDIKVKHLAYKYTQNGQVWLGLYASRRHKRCIGPVSFWVCAGAAVFFGTVVHGYHAYTAETTFDAKAFKPKQPDHDQQHALPWYFSAIGLDQIADKIKIRSTVSVSVVDSGIKFVKGLAGTEAFSKSYTTDGKTEPVKGTDEAKYIHGTAMAGVIASQDTIVQGNRVVGVAPGVKIVNRRWTPNGTNSTALLTAVEDAVSLQADERVQETIINISGGNTGTGNANEWNGLLQRLGAAGNALIVASVGNDALDIRTASPDKQIWPAAYKPKAKVHKDNDPVIRVAALAQYKSGETPQIYRGRSTGSRYGSGRVDIGAPGQNIAVLTPDGEVKPSNGTSEAAAIVSGVAALLKSCNPGATMKAIKQAILVNADKVASLEDKITEGRVLNVARAYNNFCPKKDEF